VAHDQWDDGTFQKSDQNLRFYTNCFTKEEVERLKVVLEKKFNLCFLIYKAAISKNGAQQYVLNLSRKQLPHFISLVKPFVIPSMYYKLGLNLNGKPLFEQKFYIQTILNTSEIFTLWVSQYASFTVKDKTIRLSVDQAQEKEVELLQNMLKLKFDLKFTKLEEIQDILDYI
jgi:hypothetical protein